MNKIVSPLLLIFIFFMGCISCTKENSAVEEGWVVHQDGTFSFYSGGMSITNSIPAINGNPIHPIRFSVKHNKDGVLIRYHLREGHIHLELGTDSAGFVVKTSLLKFNSIPDWIQPLSSGEVSGADRFYKQGFGFAGASGLFEIPVPRKRMEQARLKEDVWSYDSYLFTALVAPTDQTIAFSVYDHKNFQHRSTLYNRQHRIGLIDRHLDSDKVYFETGFALEEVIQNEYKILLPEIHIVTGKEPFDVLQQSALNVASVNDVGPLKSPRFYYCSWYEYAKDFSMEILKGLVAGIENMSQKPGIQAIQIDDGYSWYGDWLNENEKWPGGMQEAAKVISDAGYSPGIWVGPFMVSSNSFIFKEHKDWILRDNDGNLIKEWEKPDEDVYILDASHPDAFAYLRKVFRTFREYGFTTFKTDFMDWGIQDSKRVKRFTPGKTSVQYFTDVVAMIRKEIGEESYWLGCISPYQQMVGYVDGIRVSNDVHPNWSREGIGNMFREMYAGQFFNNILWQNDPDVSYLRDYKSSLTEEERFSIALYNGMMGGVVNTSDRFPMLTEDQLRLWHFIDPGNTHHTARIPEWGVYDDFIMATKSYENGDAALFFVNTSGKQMQKEVRLTDYFEADDIEIYRWSPFDSEFLGAQSTIRLELQSHHSQLYYISLSGGAPTRLLNGE